MDAPTRTATGIDKLSETEQQQLKTWIKNKINAATSGGARLNAATNTMAGTAAERRAARQLKLKAVLEGGKAKIETLEGTVEKTWAGVMILRTWDNKAVAVQGMLEDSVIKDREHVSIAVVMDPETIYRQLSYQDAGGGLHTASPVMAWDEPVVHPAPRQAR